MSRLPVCSGQAAIRAFQKLGYQVDHQTGSHIILRHPQMRRLTVPNHRELAKGTLRALIREAGLTKEEFLVSFDKTRRMTSQSRFPLKPFKSSAQGWHSRQIQRLPHMQLPWINSWIGRQNRAWFQPKAQSNRPNRIVLFNDVKFWMPFPHG
jgi:predicted RNA binding protein YcfA (HicA-like mRNA interferase family)